MMVVKYGRKRKIPNHLFEKKKLRKLSLFHILYSSQQFAALDFIVRERNANTNIAMEISKKNNPFIDPYENAKNDSINELLKMNTAVGRIRMNGDAPAKKHIVE